MKTVHDNCGIFAVYAQGPCAFTIYQGIDFLQHRGQQYCGIATYDGGVQQITHHGKVINNFTDQDLENLPGHWGIGHVSLWERQPVKWQSLRGEIAVAFSGSIINDQELKIVLVNGSGFTTVKQLPSPRRAHCAFEWAYTASIDSIIEGLPVLAARQQLGAALAQRDQEERGLMADMVAPVPMSGIGHALGYHLHSRLPYQEVFLYNRYAHRSYTQATQVAREKMAKRKLSVLHYAVRGKSILLCDDSIVRGTQILNKVNDLKKAGAKAVHVRVACPPLMYPCDFGISTRTYAELMARHYLYQGDIDSLAALRQLEGWVAAQIGADSVKYSSPENFVAALGLPRQDLCLKCWDGRRPQDGPQAQP